MRLQLFHETFYPFRCSDQRRGSAYWVVKEFTEEETVAPPAVEVT